MRFTRLHLAFSVLVFSLLLASSASAGTVKLTYIQSTGSGIGGGGVYPAAFYIDNSTTKTYLLCDSYDNTIRKGETWTATVSPFLQGISTSLFGSGMTLDYKAAGLIFKGMLAGTISNTSGQWACSHRTPKRNLNLRPLVRLASKPRIWHSLSPTPIAHTTDFCSTLPSLAPRAGAARRRNFSVIAQCPSPAA